MPTTAALLLLLATLACGQQAPPEFTTRRPVPDDRQADAILTGRRCTTCHTLKRVTRARYQGDEWEVCVEEMRGKEKSGISARDAGRISAFLAWWSGDDSSGPVPATPDDNPFQAPRRTIVASATVTDDAASDTAVQVGDVSFSIVEMDCALGKDGAAAIAAKVRLADTTTAVTYDRSAEGAVKVAGAEIRAWRVGTFEFAQVLHIVAVEPVPDSRPQIRFATVVERRNWKHRRIGWSPRRALELKAPVKGTPPVCPVDH